MAVHRTPALSDVGDAVKSVFLAYITAHCLSFGVSVHPRSLHRDVGKDAMFLSFRNDKKKEGTGKTEFTFFPLTRHKHAIQIT